MHLFNLLSGMGLRLAVVLAVLMGSQPVQAMTPRERIRAPFAVSLTPEAVKTNGAFLVTLNNPVFANGRVDVLALQADVRANTSKKVSRVAFTVERGGRTVYVQQERGAPYCIFGEQGNSCAARQVGDDFPYNSGLIRTGNYTVTVAVFSTATTPDWQGRVTFAWEPGRISAERPPYGTGQGNGPFAEVFDAYYTSAGMQAIKIEVRAQNVEGRPNGTGITMMRFQVRQNFGDFNNVYATYELTKPYCIFSQESDGRTCRTLQVGDKWPQSLQLVEDENGEVQGLEPDPGIPPGTIEPGEYTINIRVDADNGSWNSNGEVTLLP